MTSERAPRSYFRGMSLRQSSMRILVTAPSLLLLGQIAVCDAAVPSDVLGTWGAVDEKSGTCDPDALGVMVTTTKFIVEVAGHGMIVQPVGQPVCKANRCEVITTATSKSRIWTWIFKTTDTAVVQGNVSANGRFLEFDYVLKKGCP